MLGYSVDVVSISFLSNLLLIQLCPLLCKWWAVHVCGDYSPAKPNNKYEP